MTRGHEADAFDPSRRDFLIRAGKVGLLLATGAYLEACGAAAPSQTPSVRPNQEPYASPSLPDSFVEPLGLTSNTAFEPTLATQESGIIVPGRVIYSANTHRRIVCFSFDDGGKRMRQVMDIANRRGILMTFFPTGNAINADPKLYQEMYEAGHEIGNHTQSHANLTTLTEAKIESQILHAREALWNVVGKEVPQNLLRPPFGAGVRSSKDVDPDLLKAAKKLGYGITMWNVTSAGTSKYATVDSIKKRVESSLRNGVIVLEHPTLFDTTAFADILDYALSQGFTPQTISQGLRIAA